MAETIAGVTCYTTLELAGMLKVTRHTVREYIKQGKLKGRRVGPRTLVSEEAVRAFLLASDLGTDRPKSKTALASRIAEDKVRAAGLTRGDDAYDGAYDAAFDAAMDQMNAPSASAPAHEG